MPAIPSDFSPSSEVTDLLDLLKSLDDEQRLPARGLNILPLCLVTLRRFLNL